MRRIDFVGERTVIIKGDPVEVVACDGCGKVADTVPGDVYCEGQYPSRIGRIANTRLWTETTTIPDSPPGSVAMLKEPRLNICPECWGVVRELLKTRRAA